MVLLVLKKIKKNFFPFLVLFFVNFLFFAFIFFPKTKLISTPEYGGGDENIFHYPLKFHFQNKIKNSEFLFWSNQIGGGYPIFANIELGLLNPINYITLKFLPFDWAINVQIFVYFLILLYSSYYLAQTFKLSPVISILYALTFSYNFFNIANIIHLSHIASFFLIPLIYGLTHKIIIEKKSPIKYYLALISVLTLQLLSGHPQYFFYSILIIVLYFGIKYIIYKIKRKEIFIKFLFFIVSLFFVLLISLPQILPTLEYLKFSNERSFLVDKSLKLINFLTLLWPFFLYNSDLRGAISSVNYIPPWDSNFYFGLPILILLILLIIFYHQKLKLSSFLNQTKENILLLLIIFLMVMGNNSPIYFIYEIKPFNLFRVPERLTFVFLMILILILFFILEIFWKTKKRIIKFLIIFLPIINLFLNIYFMYTFHNFNSFDDYLINNHKLNNLKNTETNNQTRIISIRFYEQENPRLLYEEGIKAKIFKDLTLVKNSLTQNFGVFHNLSHYNLPNSAFNLKRHLYLYKLILEAEKLFPSKAYASLLSMANIQYLILPHKLKDNNNFKLISKIKGNSITFYWYELKNKPSLVYFSNKIKKFDTIDQFYDLLKKNESIIGIEEEIKIPPPKKDKFNFRYKISKYTDRHIIIEVKNEVKGMMVLANHYYPGWKAYLNGKPVKIFRANLTFQGILLEAGFNRVEFIYIPESFYQGLKISGITLLFLTFFMVIIFINRFYSWFLLILNNVHNIYWQFFDRFRNNHNKHQKGGKYYR